MSRAWAGIISVAKSQATAAGCIFRPFVRSIGTVKPPENPEVEAPHQCGDERGATRLPETPLSGSRTTNSASPENTSPKATRGTQMIDWASSQAALTRAGYPCGKARRKNLARSPSPRCSPSPPPAARRGDPRAGRSGREVARPMTASATSRGAWLNCSAVRERDWRICSLRRGSALLGPDATQAVVALFHARAGRRGLWVSCGNRQPCLWRRMGNAPYPFEGWLHLPRGAACCS
jgi:hypothetical protein